MLGTASIIPKENTYSSASTVMFSRRTLKDTTFFSRISQFRVPIAIPLLSLLYLSLDFVAKRYLWQIVSRFYSDTVCRLEHP